MENEHHPERQKPSASCEPHACEGHAEGHHHGESCGHEATQHRDHTDYVVASHLHHQHGDHCHDHGAAG
ncbi:MAG TPA: hypothetical protein VIN40_09570 [Candidatus Tyrphobacter sp.]